MTATGYEPIGNTLEKQMQNVLMRREKWLIQHPEAGSCTVLIHPACKDTMGFWLTAKGVSWATLPRGGPQPGQVWYVDGNEVMV
jgi:hypothetical protein